MQPGREETQKGATTCSTEGSPGVLQQMCTAVIAGELGSPSACRWSPQQTVRAALGHPEVRVRMERTVPLTSAPLSIRSLTTSTAKAGSCRGTDTGGRQAEVLARPRSGTRLRDGGFGRVSDTPRARTGQGS
jgi:hypothetical protein